jgi:transposase
LPNTKIAEKVGIKKISVGKWRRRWFEKADALREVEESETKRIDYRRYIEGVLSDAARPGKPAKFTEEQLCQILLVASEKPEDSDVPLSHWSLSSLSLELQRRGIVESISTSQLCIFLKSESNQAAQSG